MRVRAFKYLAPFTLYVASLIAFYSYGWLVWLPLIYAWIAVPLAELFVKPDPKNLGEAEEEMAKKDRAYDLILYIIVPLQYFAIYSFLSGITDQNLSWLDLSGRILVMGLLCGTNGINVGHELGHRSTTHEKLMAKMLLLTSLYMHFYIEHNKGHHKRVGTKEDPATARYGEWIYIFYFRTLVFSYLHAWTISNHDVKKMGRKNFSLHNEMIQYQLVELAFLAIIFLGFGWLPTLYFIIAAFLGMLLLETVNYIEHYGLRRKEIETGKYERAMPAHSWNSDHPIGRIMLFELSRHSDHHYLASRKYQTLRHHDDSPQMPTGYPGMMILSLIPPAWFFVMNRKVREVSESVGQ
jgi:alkane 1-monooxygenase